MNWEYPDEAARTCKLSGGFVCLFVCLLVCLFACLFIYLFVCLFVWLIFFRDVGTDWPEGYI
jgi:hypothetical protein